MLQPVVNSLPGRLSSFCVYLVLNLNRVEIKAWCVFLINLIFRGGKVLSLILFENGNLVLCGFLTMEVLEFFHSL